MAEGLQGLGEPGLLPADSVAKEALRVHPLLTRMMGLHQHLVGRGGGTLAPAAAGRWGSGYTGPSASLALNTQCSQGRDKGKCWGNPKTRFPLWDAPASL